MAKARAIVKRRKAVRNIRKITRTMQMIATAKFQKSLKRAVGTKPYTQKVRELVHELADSVGDVHHPLLRRPTESDRVNRIALVVITSNRGLAGAYNGSILRTASAFIRQREHAGLQIDLYVAGKKGVSFFNYQKRPIKGRLDHLIDAPSYADVDKAAEFFIRQFTGGEIDGLHIAYMNFISTSTQRAEVFSLLPLAGAREAVDRVARQTLEKEAQAIRGSMDTSYGGEITVQPAHVRGEVTYDFSPGPQVILDELLPLTVKTAMFQCFLDAVSSENVARMVAMKSATDNADKMAKALTMQYNRARQSQITTELSEIMGGVEAMNT
jgi:F-type H+-transporting ATPase subunit gamma